MNKTSLGIALTIGVCGLLMPWLVRAPSLPVSPPPPPAIEAPVPAAVPQSVPMSAAPAAPAVTLCGR